MAFGQKKHQTEQATIVFVDESGFYLTPMVIRSWAPRGQTPTLEHTLTRDHLSWMGAVTHTGRLLTMTRPHSLSGTDCARFLRHLRDWIEPPMIVVWDGSTIHRARPVRQFLKTNYGRDIQLIQLPAYAPQLNPVEPLIGVMKKGHLGNVACHDLDELKGYLNREIRSLQRNPEKVRRFFEHVTSRFSNFCSSQ